MESKNKKIEIIVFEEIQNTSAVSTEDGNKIFNRIDSEFQKGNQVILNFSNIKLLISAFLNAAIGQLYSKYKSNYLNANLSIVNLSNDDLLILKKVIERAKEYFLDRDAFEGTVNNEIVDE